MSSSSPTRVLILGGSSEATALAHALTGRTGIAVTLSFAGRTKAPIVQPVRTRIGGFGGIDGLISFLRAEEIDVLVDATHPFATRISEHAREAARQVGCRLVAVSRPAWMSGPGDNWREVVTMADAAAAIGPAPRRVFLTVGSLQLAAFAEAPQHDYLVRTIDPVTPDHGLAKATFMTARGPFDTDAEERLMRDHHIDVLLTKNSGGDAAAAKLEAARRLAIPVILVRRPEAAAASCTWSDALVKIEAHRPSTQRGV